MLIEIWERLRGLDKWTRTEATIKSSDLKEVEVGSARGTRFSQRDPIVEWQSTCVVAWTDAAGNPHSAAFAVSENSPLFQLYDGQTVTICYNPSRPDQYYLRGVLASKLVSTLKWKVIPALGIAFYILIVGMRLYFRRH
jgi:hypothetical protein